MLSGAIADSFSRRILIVKSIGQNNLAWWRGHGLWRFPNFFRSLYVDTPNVGLSMAARLHYRRLTIHRAAKRLPSLTGDRVGDPMIVYFMSGSEHWAMTAFCAYSLLRSTGANLIPVVIDDGTLDTPQRSELSRIVPQIQYLERGSCECRVHEQLPRERFPSLHAMRNDLPLMRKLMDLHAGLKGWRLFLDSDMLFFREPAWMLQWLRAAPAATYMYDFQNSYGYSDALLTSVLGRNMLNKVNTGFYGLRSESIDWDQLERWARDLVRARGTNHFSEQCLIAMLMATQRTAPAPPEYMIWPDRMESRRPSAVMHHYVAESRTWYHVYGWPGVLHGGQRAIELPQTQLVD